MGRGKIAVAERGTGIVTDMRRALGCVWVLLVLANSPCRGADLNAEQVREILASAALGKPADLAGKSLENLDLSNLDFKRANLSGANLFGAKLVGADFASANLACAKLDLAWIMRANFHECRPLAFESPRPRRVLRSGHLACRGAGL